MSEPVVSERYAEVLRDIAAQRGTPCFVYFTAPIRERVQGIARALGSRVSVSYAMKANPNVALVTAMRALVPRLDVSSGGELARAVACGWDPHAISFTGPGKSHDELALAVEHRVEVVLESVIEAERLAALADAAGVVMDVLLRVAPSRVPAGFGDQMAGRPTAFGIDEDEIDDAVACVRRSSSLRWVGLHAYSGTQCLRADAIAENWGIFAELFRAIARRHDARLQRLVFGAGLGIAHHDNQVTVDINAVATNAVPTLDALRQEPLLADAELVLESGRYLVGEAGVYLTAVNTVKRSRGADVIICDGGMNHHLAAAGHFGMVIRRPYRLRKLGAAPDAPRKKLLVCGPLCTSLDGFGRDVELPEFAVGDVLAISPSGAYGFTSSPLGFISHPVPSEHLVEDGELLR